MNKVKITNINEIKNISKQDKDFNNRLNSILNWAKISLSEQEYVLLNLGIKAWFREKGIYKKERA